MMRSRSRRPCCWHWAGASLPRLLMVIPGYGYAPGYVAAPPSWSASEVAGGGTGGLGIRSSVVGRSILSDRPSDPIEVT